MRGWHADAERRLALRLMRRAGACRCRSRVASRGPLLLWLVVAAAMLAYVMWPVDRSYTISALTRGAQIALADGGKSDWRLKAPTVCRPLAIRPRVAARPASGPGPAPICDHLRYEVSTFSAVELNWPAGTVLTLTKGGDGLVRILVEAVPESMEAADAPPLLPPFLAGRAVVPGTLIVLSEASYAASGALPFFGCLQVGLEVRAGGETELLAGRYETRETLFPRSTPERVDEGEFVPGDSIAFEREESWFPSKEESGCATVQGFFSVAGPSSSAGLRVVAYASLGRPVLTVNRLGLETAAMVPSWTDRAIKDPWLIGIAALLSIVSALKSLLIDSPGSSPKASTIERSKQEGAVSRKPLKPRRRR